MLRTEQWWQVHRNYLFFGTRIDPVGFLLMRVHRRSSVLVLPIWNPLGSLVQFTSVLVEHEEVNSTPWFILWLWLVSGRECIYAFLSLGSQFLLWQLMFLPFLNTRGSVQPATLLKICPRGNNCSKPVSHLTRIWAVLSAPQAGDVKMMQYTGAMTYLLSHLSRSIALGNSKK